MSARASFQSETLAGVPEATLADRPRPTLHDTIRSPANNFTLVRLVLAGSVIFFHSYWMVAQTGEVDPISRWLQPMTSLGGMAVACFFFLSGLFVTQSFHRDPSVAAYTLRRAARIWPGLFVCVAATTVVAAFASQGSDAWRLFLTPEFHKYISKNAALQMEYFVPGIYESTRTRGLNGSLYTLPIEVTLYAVVAVVGLFGLMRNARWISGTSAILLAVLLLRPTLFTEPMGVVKHGQLPLAMFFAGCLLYGFATRVRVRPWQAPLLLVLTAISSGPLHTAAFFATAIWTMLYVGQLPIPPRFRLQHDISYGTYIYGYPCQQLILVMKPDIDAVSLTVIALLLAMACARASWRLVEKPGIDFARYWIARWRQRAIPDSLPSTGLVTAPGPLATRGDGERPTILIATLMVLYIAITAAWLLLA